MAATAIATMLFPTSAGGQPPAWPPECGPDRSMPAEAWFYFNGIWAAHNLDRAKEVVPVVANPLITGEVRKYQNVKEITPGSSSDPCFARFGLRVDSQGFPVWSLVEQHQGAEPPQFLPLTFPQWSAVNQFRNHGGQQGDFPYSQLVYNNDATTPLEQRNFPVNLTGFGFRLGIHQLEPLSIGDWIDPSPTLGSSSLALVPPGLSDNQTGWNGLNRPVLEGSVDLTTGLPLASFTDLELPFDGATFRLTRTRSHNMSSPATRPIGTDPGNQWWDWAGLGWMASENPILLIDSSVPDIVGDNPKTTRLVLDAHRSIPFQLIESDGRYEAPPRFRATLKQVGGVWGIDPLTNLRTWTTRPKQYVVSLYEGAITYRFTPIYDLTPTNLWIDEPYTTDGSTGAKDTLASHNSRPLLPDHFPSSDPRYYHNPWDSETNPGTGMPHLGICTSIEDKQGHIAEISYVDALWRAADDYFSEDCIECLQDVQAIGQIRSIKLKTRNPTTSSTTTRWTLVYTHRRFGGAVTNGHGSNGLMSSYDLLGSACPEVDALRYETQTGSNAIDRIYVYGDDPSTSANEAELSTNQILMVKESVDYTDLTSSDLAFVPDSLAGQDWHERNEPLQAQSRYWTHQIRYHYDFWQGPDEQILDPMLHAFWMAEGSSRAKPEPRLVMTSCASRNPSQPASVRVKHHVFDYRSSLAPGLFGNADAGPWLNTIFEPEAVGRAMSADISWLDTASQAITPSLLAWATQTTTTGTPLNPSTLEALRQYASTEFRRFDMEPGVLVLDWPVESSTSSPNGHLRPPSSSLWNATGNSYLTIALNRAARDRSSNAVSSLTVRNGDGVNRHFRIHRVLHTPFAIPGASSTQANLNDAYLPEALVPMLSQWFVPYSWRAYGGSPHTDLPKLDESRYISIIDEFESQEARDSESAYYGTNGLKPGLISRRIVEVNASGVVLKDRQWQYGPEGTMVSGGGLGEEFIYKTAYDYFLDTLGQAPATATPWVPPGQPQPVTEWQIDQPPSGPTLAVPTRQTMSDLLLVQHRSVGWSVAAQPGSSHSSASEGLVHSYSYDLFLPEAGPDIDWGSRIQLTAEGIQRGAGGTASPSVASFTRQIMRDPIHPERVTHEIEFLDQTTTLLTSLPSQPSPTTEVAGRKVTYFHTELTTSGPNEGSAKKRVVISPPRKLSPTSALYYPIEAEWYDDNGNMKWSATGLLQRPNVQGGLHSDETASGSLSSLVLTYYKRNGSGQSDVTVLDADPGAQDVSVPAVNLAATPEPLDIPEHPDQWDHLPVHESPTSFVTAFGYDEFGPSDVVFPGGNRWARRWVCHTPRLGMNPPKSEDSWVEEFIFTSLQPASGGGSNFTTNSPVERKVYFAARPGGPTFAAEKGTIKEAAFNLEGLQRDEDTFLFELVDNPSTQDPTDKMISETHTQSVNVSATGDGLGFTPFARVLMARDANGRPREASLLERDPTGAMLAIGSREINELVDVRREREIDGNITRMTRNLLGHHMRTYTGTADQQWEGDHTQGSGPHNMIIKERVEYGLGIHDAWLPCVHRRYMKHPLWADNFYAVPGSDSDGIASVTGYDWRMRPVRTDNYARGAITDTTTLPRLSTTLTYLDHADRPRLVVSYGEGTIPPSVVDPTTRLNSVIPLISTFFPSSTSHARPTSVVEYVYGPDDSANEIRTYDLSWSGGTNALQYQSEFHYFGRGGREVFTQRPDGTMTITDLDGSGRPIAVRTAVVGVGTVAEPYELSRTEYTYDSAGNQIEVRRLERLPVSSLSASDRTLVAGGATANAVMSRTWTWFDSEKRRVASAELGAESDLSSNGVALYVPRATTSLEARPAQAPTVAGAVDGVIQSSTFSVDTGNSASLARAKVWVYLYDRKGNLVSTVEPSLAVSRNVYDQNNRLKERIENALPTGTIDPVTQRDTAGTSRRTVNQYQYGRLTEMYTPTWGGMVATSGGPPFITNAQRHHVTFGADVMDSQFKVVSKDNSLVGMVWIRGVGSDPGDRFRLRYNFAGQIAERTDARGVTMRYLYDDAGRLAKVQVCHYTNPDSTDPVLSTAIDKGYPPSMQAFGQPLPANLVCSVVYDYNDRGLLERVIAERYTLTEDPYPATVEFTYDLNGNLLRESQEHAGVVTTSTPHVDYTWEYEPTDVGAEVTGHRRLTSTTYPAWQDRPARVVNTHYIDASTNPLDSSGLSDRLSRVARYTTNAGSASPLAEFGYTGSGRRATMRLAGGAIAQSLDTDPNAPGLEGLDEFGQPVDLHYVTRPSAGTPVATLFRSVHRYDIMGNRTASQITQASGNGVPAADARSSVHQYNKLNQLIGSDVGQITLSPTGGALVNPSVSRRETWRLDALGNRNGNDQVDSALLATWGHSLSLNGGLPLQSDDSVDNSAQLHDRLSAVVDSNGVPVPGTSSSTTFYYDPAGNLKCDGTYYYEYDAWNRLVQISRAQSLFFAAPPYQTGPVDEFCPFTAGTLLKHFAYDGLGRLIRTQSPWPTPPPDGETANIVRCEHFYYDGVRRIQEVLSPEIYTLQGLTESQIAALEALAAGEYGVGDFPDPKTASTELEEKQLLFLQDASNLIKLSREYVWGPGDGHGGLDELLVQFDADRNSWWTLQDDGGDIVALCDLGGPLSSPGSLPTARVMGQWTYNAYGECLTADTLYAHPAIHAGHKGLFLERLDEGVAEPLTGEEILRLVPYAHNLYHVRNRVYAPGLGRFLQPDTNASGQTLLEGASHSGRGMGAIAAAFDLDSRLGDGLNLYEYLGSNPWRRSDPMGLSWDPFDMVDDYLAERAGNAAALLTTLGKSVAAVQVVAATILSYLPIPAASIAGELALAALGEQSANATALALAVGLIPGGKLGILLGKIGSAAWKAAKHYAVKAARFVMKWSGMDFMWRATKWMARKAVAIVTPGVCGCFTASTVVWTSTGMVPIANVAKGDQVIAYNESTGQIDLRAVTDTIEIPGAMLLRIVLQHGDGHLEMIETTDEHPFLVVGRVTLEKAWKQAWSRADLLRPGDTLTTLAGTASVLSLHFTSERQTVHNLTVEGLATYHVGPDGVVVHNCGAGFHHLVAKYLWIGGLQSDALYTKRLSSSAHTALHKLIDEAGSSLNIPSKRAGRARVEAWALEVGHDVAAERIAQALRTAHAKFDLIHGENTYTELVQALERLGY